MTFAAVAVAGVGAAASIGTSMAQQGAAGDANKKARQAVIDAANAGLPILQDAQTQGAAAINSATTTASKRLKPYNQAGQAAIPELQALVGRPDYTLDEFNRQNGTNLSMEEILRKYSPEQYLSEWGINPRQYLDESAYAKYLTPGDFKASPDYAWRKSQGMDGIQSSAAAKGGLLSGATLKALETYNSNLASQEFGNWWNRDFSNRQMGLNTKMQANQMGLANYWNSNNADAANRSQQLGQFNQGFNQDYMSRGQDAGILQNLMSAGQNAATQQGSWGYGAGQSLADLFSRIALGKANTIQGVGSDLGNLALGQGQNQAAIAGNIGNAINSGISNAMLLNSLNSNGQQIQAGGLPANAWLPWEG